MTVVAMLCAGACGYLLFRPTASTARPSRPWDARRAGPWTLAVLVGGAGLLATVLDGSALVLGLIAMGCLAAVVQLLARSRRLREQVATRRRVVEAGEALVGELRAGQPPVSALGHCVEMWPALGPVAAAARLGADVPASMHRLAARPGAEGLHDLASAWRVSERSGAGLTGALGQVVETARAEAATAQLVRAELASAQATARLVAALPLLTLAMASGTGADPWAFLAGHPVGLACLASAAALVFLGLWWIDRIAAAVANR